MKILIVNENNFFKKNLKLKKIDCFHITDKKDFSFKKIKKIEPKIIFFPHWHWKVEPKIFDNYYGTSKDSVNKLLKGNNDILFDIDWQETQKLSKFKELKLIKVFLLPPDKKELENRLIQRNQDNIDIISKRLQTYDDDIHHWSDYDHVIINDNLEHCFLQLEKIILSEKNKTI